VRALKGEKNKKTNVNVLRDKEKKKRREGRMITTAKGPLLKPRGNLIRLPLVPSKKQRGGKREKKGREGGTGRPRIILLPRARGRGGEKKRGRSLPSFTVNDVTKKRKEERGKGGGRERNAGKNACQIISVCPAPRKKKKKLIRSSRGSRASQRGERRGEKKKGEKKPWSTC